MILPWLADSVSGVDSLPGSQEVYSSHMHAMCAAGLSSAICEKNFYNYVNKQLNSCSKGGLAKAIHAWQDSFSGGHNYFKTYSGFWKLPFSHLLYDTLPSPEERRVVTEATRAMMGQFDKKCGCGE